MIAADLPRLALVAVSFPKFTDGRGYSTARILRDRYKFAGELRAIGDILFDQIQLYGRSGFDSLEITDAVTIKLLESGRKPVMTHFYQPGEGPEVKDSKSPWRRLSTSQT
jgi:phosphoadenosine phosphosulfate reductase